MVKIYFTVIVEAQSAKDLKPISAKWIPYAYVVQHLGAPATLISGFSQTKF